MSSRGVRAVFAAVMAALVLTAPASAQVASPTVEGPVEGGVRGFPWGKSLRDLDPYGYTEREFFFSGDAESFSRGVSAPYRSRMLVRLPQDPSKFNGTVVVEWLNVTGGTDLETVWPTTGEFLMS